MFHATRKLAMHSFRVQLERKHDNRTQCCRAIPQRLLGFLVSIRQAGYY